MTMRTSLLLLAASLAPLYAQQSPAPEAPAAQVSAVSAAEQRAAVFSALAQMPANVSEFLVFTNIGGNFLRLAESGKIPDLTVDDLPDELLAIDNAAIASTLATPGTYAYLRALVGCLRTHEGATALASNWGINARDNLTDTIVETLYTQSMLAAQKEGAAPGQPIRIPATCMVLTCKPGQEALLQTLSEELLPTLQENVGDEVTLVNNENGFSGIRIDLAEMVRESAEEEEEHLAACMQELSKHSLCILLRQQGNALIIALCESPQDLQLPATANESVLSLPFMAEYDAQRNKGMLMAGHLSKECSNFCQSVNNDYLLYLATGVSAVFHTLGEADATAKPTYDKAAAALTQLSQSLHSLTPAIEQATSFQAWCDDNLHFSLSTDAGGYSYAPGKLRLAALADAPQNIFYAETTPICYSGPQINLTQLTEAALSVTEALALTLNESNAAQVNQVLAMSKLFAPELQALVAASSTIGSGLDGQLAVVMDTATGPLPLFAQAPQGATADIPRLAIYAGVSDRSQLSSGWDAIMTSAGEAIGKLGGDPNTLSMLPIAATGDAQCMSYYLALPFFTQDTTPSLTVSDTGLSFGTSEKLNHQVVTSATGTTDFAGCVFSCKLAPLAKSFHSLSAAMAPSTLPKQQKAAQDLKEAATVLDQMSTIAESVFGLGTVREGKHIMQVDIELK